MPAPSSKNPSRRPRGGRPDFRNCRSPRGRSDEVFDSRGLPFSHYRSLLSILEAFTQAEIERRERLQKLSLVNQGILVPTFPGAAAPSLGAPYLYSFFLYDSNPYSVAFSLRRARENARTVREVLTMEVFLNLNETYRELEGHGQEATLDLPSLRGGLAATLKGAGNPGPDPATNILGKLHSMLSYEEDEIVRRADFGSFLDHLLRDLDRAHEAISRQYFVT